MRKRRTASRETKIERAFQQASPLRSKNFKQQEYMNYIQECPIVVATGYPGTGKTYIAARMAAQWFKQGRIDNIVLSRPSISTSKSLGFFKGTKNEKMQQWLAPVLSALREEFAPGELEYFAKEEIDKITFCPLEVIKGLSWKNSFIIVDEAEDCTLKELKAILTRIGKNSRVVLSGDLGQSDLGKNAGLSTVLEMCCSDERFGHHVRHINFDDPDMIVRSPTCREMILGFERAENGRNKARDN